MDITLDGFMITKTGSIQSISKDPKSDGKGGKLIDIEVTVPNDNSMDAGTNVSGSVTIGGRTVDSQGKNTLQYLKVTTILAGTTGSVSVLPFKTGSMVHLGNTIAKALTPLRGRAPFLTLIGVEVDTMLQVTEKEALNSTFTVG